MKLCGDRGWAGPSACIRKRGHQGDHEYGEYDAACLRELHSDAARYRWLLANRVSENDEGEKCIYFWCDFDNYNDVDAAIDAAMAESKP